MNNEEIFIGTDNEKIIEYVKNKRSLAQTTHIVCAKCGGNNKISNYEFINNFEAYYVEKGFSIIQFKCYHCKNEYDLSASINTFSNKIIQETNEASKITFTNIVNSFFRKSPIDTISQKFISSNLKEYEQHKPEITGDPEYDLYQEKVINELQNISEETKLFLVSCGMNTLKEIYDNLIDQI